jgi:ribosomal protein L37AE/L43A
MLVQSQIVSLLNEILNQTARLRKNGAQAVYFCPCCHHYKRKLEVNLETGQWHCWTCNIKGSYLGSFLTKVKASDSYRQKMAQLTGDLRLAQRRKPTQAPNEVVLPEEFLPLSKPVASVEYKNAVAYLKRRGILREDILRYNIGYCEEGDYAFHIVVPSYDAEGNLNFFIGRRYYDVEGMIPHKKPEVSMDIVGFESFVNYNEPLSLCEGFFDAMAIRNNAIPLFGKYPSKKLRQKMILHGTRRVNMVLDDDAFKDAVRNYEMLVKDVPNLEVHVVSLSGKDPSALGFIKTHEIIRASRPFDESDLLAYELSI